MFQVPLNDPDKMIEFQKLMNKIQDENTNYCRNLAKTLGIPYGWATDIWYLRTRSRWTQELENELIRMAKAGEPGVNICDWP